MALEELSNLQLQHRQREYMAGIKRCDTRNHLPWMKERWQVLLAACEAEMTSRGMAITIKVCKQKKEYMAKNQLYEATLVKTGEVVKVFEIKVSPFGYANYMDPQKTYTKEELKDLKPIG